MGIPAGLIVWKYVLRNSLVSTVTQIGLLFGILLAGAVVIETVFQWPGIGAYAFEAILQSDYPGVMGFTVYAGFVFGVVNLIVDVSHAVLDPREAAA
jgi:peptide/nickel transport system permease protein